MFGNGFKFSKTVAGLLLAAGAMGGSLTELPAAAQSLSAQYVPVITKFAGVSGSPGYTGNNGPAAVAQLNGPWGVTYDAAGNLYIADSKNSAIRRVDAVTGLITTVAGTGQSGYAGDGGPATAALLSDPEQVAFDPAGNMYIADHLNNVIREVDAQTGIISTVVGNGVKGSFTVGVAGTATKLNQPRSVQIDSAGNIFVANSAQNAILEIPAATGLTVAYGGTGQATSTGDGGLATAASIAGPYNMTLDRAGNLYLTDHTNHVIRKITASTRIISTVVGTSGVSGNSGDGGLATAATLNAPSGAFIDKVGNLYIASTGANTVRMVNAQTGIISTLAGNGVAGSIGTGGAAIAAQLNGDSGVAVSPDGSTVAIANLNSNIVNVVFMNNDFPTTAVGNSSAAQTISVLATATGTANSFQLGAGLSADFSVGAPTGCPGAMSASSLCSAPVIFTPTAPGLRNSPIVLTDSANNPYILGLSGTGTSPAAAFLPGTISSFAGTGNAGSTGDNAAASAATLNRPAGVALDAASNLYIADTANNKVRMVTAGTGVISTFAGTGAAGSGGDGSTATSAELNSPASISLDAAGNLYIADTVNNRIRKVSAQTGNISTVAGTGVSGSNGDGEAATAATLNTPYGIAADSNGNLYIADSGNNKIRKVNVYTGLISTIATAATLSNPEGVALDASGNLYIADTGNNLVREVTNGVVTTIAGSGTAGYTGDNGLATAATLNAPTAVSVDAAGDIYITDSGNNCIRMIAAATGEITTIAGTGSPGLSGNGGPSSVAQLQNPAGIVVDASGNYYIADTTNNRVVLVNATQPNLAFGNVNNGSTSAPQSISLLNIGNQSLVLSGLSVSPSLYQQLTTASTDCTATTSLAPGASCQVRVAFSPAVDGSVPGTVTLTDNALNAASATQTINLTGNGVTVGAATAVTVVAGSQQTAAPLGAFPIAFQALVTDNNNYPVSGVTVTFTAPSSGAGGTFANGLNTVSATTAANGIATASILTASGNRGTFTVTATTPGVTTPATFTETIAGNIAPALTLGVSSGSMQYGQSATITATLSPAVFGGTPATGTVTFYDNGTAIGTGAVTSGAAGITYAAGAGTRSLTASYSGDSNFSVSTTTGSVSLVVTPLPVTATVSSPSLPYGSTLHIVGTLTGVLSKDASNVSVVFMPATSSQTPDVGQYALNANLTGSAAANYTATVIGSPTLTITQASTVTTLSASSMQPSLGSSTTFTATVVSTVSGGPVPTGTVTFYNGTTNLGTATLNAGVASLPISTLAAGTQQITAVYAGSQDNSGSTSSALAVTVITADYSISVNSSTATVQQGGLAYITLTVAANQAFTGTVAFSCSGLPANSNCVFTPATVVGSGTSLLQIVTSGSSTAKLMTPFGDAGTVLAAIFLPGVLLGGLTRRRRLSTLSRKLLVIFGMAAGLAVACGISGCGSQGSPAYTVNTPVGTSSISITSQSAGLAHTVSLTLNVTKAQ